MTSQASIFQVCVVVEDVRKANANWAKVLRCTKPEICTIFSGDIIHFTHGASANYTDCQVAKYELDAFVLELIQPGPSASPWREHLEQHGEGVFHFCVKVEDRKSFQATLSEIGVGLPYHIGYYPGGSYSYVDSSRQLGIDLSVNHYSDYTQVMHGLLSGAVRPFEEAQ